jgi:hypothetical protein
VGLVVPASTFAASTAAATAPSASTVAAATTTATSAVSAATAAAATPAISAAATTAIAAPSATGWAIFARPRFVYRQRTPFKILSMESPNRILRVLIRGHRHKGKTAGFPREFVLHKHHFIHGAGLCKEVLQGHLGGAESEIADVEFVSHILVSLA